MRRMKKRIYHFMLAVILLLTMTGTLSSSGAQAAAANRYNVVFVIDASGSMKKTDGFLWRYEAIDLFLGLATDKGNYMGAVIFNDGIVATMPLQEISGKEMKTLFSQNLRNAPVRGDTDIGGAFLTAVDMLNANKNPNLRSAIILLSDGNTDFPNDNTGERLTQSNNNKQEAINKARENGYPVFSVCLNANNTANTAELRDISNATAGQFVEVGEAEDLKTVFANFYNIIYSTETIPIADEALPDSGVLEIPFSVPSAGVEELNIIISTLSPDTQYTLFPPSGKAYTRDELDTYTIWVETFSITKIPKPAGGMWKIQARGIPGDAVKIDMVYNANFSVKTVIQPAGPDFNLGDRVTFMASILSNGEELTDSGSYAVYPATLTLFKASDGSEAASTLMQAEQLGYRADISLNMEGDFYATVTVKFEGLEKSSERILMAVSGVQPTETQPPETGTSQPNQSSVSQPSPSSPTNPSQGSASQTYAESPSEIGSVLKIAAMAAVAVLGLALLAILFRLLWPHMKPSVFRGDVMISAFDHNSGMSEAPQMIQPVQGKEKLSRYLTQGGGINLDKTYLKADKSPEFIWLMSDSGLYSGNNPEKKEKKIRLYSGMEVTVSRNCDLDSGLQITYTAGNIMY